MKTLIAEYYGPRTALIILAILYCVGILGFLSPYREGFAALTPVNLLITLALLLSVSAEDGREFLVFLLITFAGTWAVEAVGVNTGLIFGEYAYGPNLGPRIWGTPLLIGVNWLLLAYPTALLFRPLSLTAPEKSLFGALLLVGMDVFIEPVAMNSGFWDWQDGQVPVQNYIGWFITGFLVLLLFHLLVRGKPNPLAGPVLLIQLFFFFIINLALLS